jgi:hypothetical protein
MSPGWGVYIVTECQECHCHVFLIYRHALRIIAALGRAAQQRVTGHGPRKGYTIPTR